MIDGDIQIRWMREPCKSTLHQRSSMDYGPHSINRDIQEPPVVNTITPPSPPNPEDAITYTYLEASSIRGNGILIDNKVYSYTKKRDNTKNTTHWRRRYHSRPTMCKYNMKHIRPETAVFTIETLIPVPTRNPHQHTCTQISG